MLYDPQLPPAIQNRMRKAFFDQGDGLILTYLDPLIGQLRNTKWSLEVRINPEARAFEVCVDAAIVARDPILPDIEKACKAAMSIYHRALDQRCHQDMRHALAA